MQKKEAMKERVKVMRLKRAANHFFCALCGVKREISVERNLGRNNYLHIVIISAFTFICAYPWFGVKSFIFFFVICSLYALVHHLIFRKEIVCPHCGFDAAWYRKDVRKAKAVVENFWQSRVNYSNELNNDRDS